MIETKIVENNGNKQLEVPLGGKTFYLPFKLIAGRWVGFLDISGQVSLIEAAADEIVAMLEEKNVAFDTILNPVSKSNAFAHAIAVRWSRKHPELTHTVVARKSTSKENVVRASYRSVTTDKDQVLSLTPDDTAYIKGKCVLMVDDVFGGGGTTKALNQMLEQAGAVKAAHAVIAVEKGSSFPDDLFYLFELPVL